MAAENGTTSTPLAKTLRQAPYRFEFYRAMRLLECHAPEHPRHGEALHPRDEPFRLGQEASLAFAPGSLDSWRPGRDGRPDRLMVACFGLMGPNGPLPLHITAYARDRLRNSDDETLSRFLDIFQHRLIGLFFRAWANAEPALHFDRPATDRFRNYLGAVSGRTGPAFQDRDAMPDRAKLFFAGHLGALPRNPDGLRDILAGYFKLPVHLVEFVGQWIQLDPRDQWRLGAGHDGGRLGQSITVGERVWDRQQKFGIQLGPLRWRDYVRFVPGADSLTKLNAVVRNFIGDELMWELKLVLRHEEIPPLVLGSGRKLGQAIWLITAPPREDADDLVLDPMKEEVHD